MTWTPEMAAELASINCECAGAGMHRDGSLCECVCRAVFRACHRAFEGHGLNQRRQPPIPLDHNPQHYSKRMPWIRCNEDYRADFHACGRRALPKHLYQVFSFYHLLGGTPELVADRLGISRAYFFENARLVEIEVGRAIAYLKPYSLYPPYLYGVQSVMNDQLPMAS